MNNAKVFLMDLEAFEPTLLERWTASGDLPNLRMLMEQGSYRRLDTTAGLLTASVWGVFNIGKEPENTGLYYDYQWDARRMRIYRENWGVSKYSYFWTRLSQMGKRTIVIDPDLAKVQPQENSIQIIGWQSHEGWSHPDSWPREAMSRVILQFGREPFGIEEPLQGRPERQAASLSQILRSVRKRTGLLLHFIRNEPWDFFLAGFPEPHRAGHQLWGFPENGGTVRQETATEPGTALKEVYQAIDEAVGELLAALPPDSYVLACSTYGMGPHRGSHHLLGTLLQRLDAGLHGDGNFSVPTKPPTTSPSRHLIKRLLSMNSSPLIGIAAQTIPKPIKIVLRHHLTVGGLDWRRTRMFSLPTDDLGYIRFNLHGREAKGVVSPGEELKMLTQELEHELENGKT